MAVYLFIRAVLSTALRNLFNSVAEERMGEINMLLKSQPTLRGVIVACSDRRPKFPEVATALGLALKLVPGVDLEPTIDLVSFWNKHYPGMPFITGPHPDDCHWYQGSYLCALNGAYLLSVYMKSHGVPSACLSFHDGWGKMEYNGLFGHEDLAEDIVELIESPDFNWTYRQNPVANALVIGHHHTNMAFDGALRISSLFLTDKVFPRIGGVLDAFRGNEPLPTYFSAEVSVKTRGLITERFLRHNMPVVFAQAS